MLNIIVNMKKIYLLFLVLFACFLADAQTHVQFDLTDAQFSLSSTTNRQVTVQACGIQANGQVVLLPYSLTRTTDATGSTTFSNLYGSVSNGYYKVTIPAPPLRSDFYIHVLDTNLGLVKASSIISAPGVNPSPNVVTATNLAGYALVQVTNIANAIVGSPTVNGSQIVDGTITTNKMDAVAYAAFLGGGSAQTNQSWDSIINKPDVVTNGGTWLAYQGTPSWVTGKVFYDTNQNTLAYYNDDSAVMVNLGAEQLVRVSNKSGATILNGSVVYVSGAQGQTPTIELAIATNELKSGIIGVATHDITNNFTGYVTVSGRVNELNTSAFNDGDSLYLSETTLGGLQTNPPTAPNYMVSLGTVLYSHSQHGKILVNITPQWVGWNSVIGKPTFGTAAYSNATAFASSSVTNLTAAQLARLNAAVTNSQTGVTLSGAFDGSASGLTNLNAANLTGTLSSNVFPASLKISGVSIGSEPDTLGADIIADSALNYAIDVAGRSFSGGWNGSGLTNLQNVVWTTKIKDPTGFIGTPSGTFSCSLSGSSNRLTWTGSASYLMNGEERTLTSVSVLVPTNTGNYFVFIPNGGTSFVVSNTAWALTDLQFATVFSDGANTPFVITELHRTMPAPTHERFHLDPQLGAAWISGFSFSTNGGIGCIVGTGQFFDEDIHYTVPGVTSNWLAWRKVGSSYMNYTFDGRLVATNATGGLQWDNAGTLTDASVNGYVNSWVYVMPNADTNKCIVSVVGQSTSTLLATIRAEEPPTLLPGFASQEAVLLYRVTYRQSGGVATYIETTDYRQSKLSGSSVISGATGTFNILSASVVNGIVTSASEAQGVVTNGQPTITFGSTNLTMRTGFYGGTNLGWYIVHPISGITNWYLLQ